MKQPFVMPILKRLAPKAGVKLNVEPHYGYVAQVVLKNGTKRYLRGTNFDLNPSGAAEIAKDKDYANFFMRGLGYPVIEGEAFLSPKWAKAIGSTRTPEAAYRYARKLKFPLIVKPNSLSQGRGVTKVYNKKDFMGAVKKICAKNRVFLVQRFEDGHDYRIVVLDNEVLSAYERLPLNVTGNGKSTILQLLKQKQRQFARTGYATVINPNDPRTTGCLNRLGLSRRSILPKGKTINLLDNRNLSTGGDAVDVTDTIHASYRKLCVKLTRDMGLRYCGVDLMVKGDITKPVSKYVVLEINSAPGIGLYANADKKHKKLVDQIYLKVLKAMTR